MLPVIKESRDITNYLAHVLAKPDAIEYLRKSRNLVEAYDLTDGEEARLRRLLGGANARLSKALSIVHRVGGLDVFDDAIKCEHVAARVARVVRLQPLS